jgi:hypothetical protein
MARIRGIKPEFFKDEDLACLPIEARLFFIGLWCFADKSGRLEDRPKYLKVEIFPYDNYDVENLLQILADPKITDRPNKVFIRRYEVNGRKYIDIPEFSKHQGIHHTERESTIPEFNGYLTVKERLNNGDITVTLLEEKEKEVEVEVGQNTFCETVVSPPPKTPIRKKQSTEQSINDQAWLECLKENPAYTGLDVDICLGKMIAWCEANGKKPTRRRFVNWLNREERPLHFVSEGHGNNGNGTRVKIIPKLTQEEQEIVSKIKANMPGFIDNEDLCQKYIDYL